MLSSQGSLGILFSNGLVGGITTLSLIMLFWPLISKVLRTVMPGRPDKLAEQQPVD
jgi:putative tricarboxylic transport membrane protein